MDILKGLLIIGSLLTIIYFVDLALRKWFVNQTNKEPETESKPDLGANTPNMSWKPEKEFKTQPKQIIDTDYEEIK